MNSRTVISVTGFFASLIFLAVFFTDNYGLLGILLGFITGLVNIQWLFKDARKAVDDELEAALRRYRRSLFSRLGMVTLVVAVMGKYRPEWLFYLTLGIAAGIIIPLILAIREQFLRENERG